MDPTSWIPFHLYHKKREKTINKGSWDKLHNLWWRVISRHGSISAGHLYVRTSWPLSSYTDAVGCYSRCLTHGHLVIGSEHCTFTFPTQIPPTSPGGQTFTAKLWLRLPSVFQNQSGKSSSFMLFILVVKPFLPSTPSGLLLAARV